ncbi:hypothetical protein F4818DRAFT_443512 [Hypoxylon cercidicola]|nr:hypothetical protein F4818DRAFT_443512 [Hypoxylon cercidicola]
MSTPTGNQYRDAPPHPNMQPIPFPNENVYFHQPHTSLQAAPFQQVTPSLSGFPPPQPLPLPRSQQALATQPTEFSWVSLRVIKETLMPHEPWNPVQLMEAETPDLPYPFNLTFQDLALETYLADEEATGPPPYLVVDMMSMVGPAPMPGTVEYQAYLLNKYSYWIPFTKFVAEYEMRSRDDGMKLVALVKMLTDNSMLQPAFVYECFAYAIHWCSRISQTGVEIKRLRIMMFNLHQHGLILNGPLTPTNLGSGFA